MRAPLRTAGVSRAGGRPPTFRPIIEIERLGNFLHIQTPQTGTCTNSRADEEYEMRVTKRQLRRIIREEKSRLINEQNSQWAGQFEDLAPGESANELLSFADAYAGLGNAVQEQVNAVVKAYLTGAERLEDSEQYFLEVVYEQNHSAIEMAFNNLRGPLEILKAKQSRDVLDALWEAMTVIEQSGTEDDPDMRAAKEEN
jgi:hypothetical protein